MKRLIITVCALIFGISFCMAQNQPGEPDVYVAGFIGDNAVLWKNGVAQPLTALTREEEFANAVSVFVTGNDVYAAGSAGAIYDGNGVSAISLWKNGVAQDIKPVDEWDHWNGGTSVYVSGNDVYVGAVGGLWKNGAPQNGYGFVSSVYVSGSDLYAAGGDRSGAKLWKNGAMQNLTDGTREASAKSVFVSGGDVYVAGFEKNVQGDSLAVLWKNGAASVLTGGTSANSVFVSGSDVYVAGYGKGAKGKSVAKLWKNGEAQNLTDGTRAGVACSVHVLGSGVYVAGYAGGRAVVWKNGAVQNLTDGKINARAFSVFIVPDEAQRRQMAEEQRLREQQIAEEQKEQLYQNSIASAQQNFERKQYEQARQDYVTALNLKPEEAASINSKIEEIDKKLNEPATLHLYRPRQLLGSILPVRYDVVLDNAVVGRTNNNWKTTVTVTSFGAKTLSAVIDGRKAEVQVNIAPGGVYYLRCDLDTKEVDTGKKDKNGKAVKEYIYTPILQLVDENLGASEFNKIK